VHDAIDALGPPPYPRQIEALPAIAPRDGDRRAPGALSGDLGRARGALRAELESAVHEAFRLEVRPVAQHVAELGALFEQVLVRIEEVSTSIEDERRDRLQDVALLTELVTSGWRSVDRRLARLEEIAARLEAGREARSEARLYRLDEASGTTPTE
jgi:hypothetical protein